MTVAATTRDDKLLPASNRGTCVDVLSPGEDIVSAGGRLATRTQSNAVTGLPSDMPNALLYNGVA